MAITMTDSQKKDLETREKVLRAAGRVFAEKGFKSATVREICQLAGVNLASVNYYFGDKERLYLAAVRAAHKLRVESVPMPDRGDLADPETRLRDFIFTLLRRMLAPKEDEWQSNLMLREVLNPSAACQELVQDYFRPHFEMLSRTVSELVPAGTMPERVRQICFSIVGQCFYHRVAGAVVPLIVDEDEYATHYSVDALAEHIFHFSLAAVRIGNSVAQAQND
ncbi:MAG: AcrR family transcriptional regulator [Pirellulaceae bacterium]|jgi:AcrR family transcriptional regulator